MNREDIIRMAREAGFGVLRPSPDYRGEIYDGDGTLTDEMERFAALVAAAEREACARLAEEQPTFTRYAEEVLEDVVKLIRARGDACRS
jgi:hypothetical protein